MLNYTHFATPSNVATVATGRKLAAAAVALALLAGLSGCGPKAQRSGQSLVSVNGEEITASQLNEEMQRAGVAPAQQQAASKQLLESLIERQLLVNEAVKEKTDREPQVVQAIERAKALIIAQSYLQKKVGPPAKPSKTDVQAYFDQHPELFSGRKQLEMRQVLLATAEISDELKKVMDDAKSLDEVVAWMDQHKVRYARNEVARSSADLPPALSAKLLSMPKGQLFVIREGDRSVLVSIVGLKDTPVDLAAATPQIEQYLSTTRAKEAATAEMARLRAAAKIEYLNKSAAPAAAADAKPAAAADAKPGAKPDAAVDHGVAAGLK